MLFVKCISQSILSESLYINVILRKYKNLCAIFRESQAYFDIDRFD